MIFNLNDLTDIYADIMNIIISEQQPLNELFSKSFSNLTSPDILEDYSEIQEKNIVFLDKFYIKFPLTDIQITSSPSQALLSQLNDSKSSRNNESKVSSRSSSMFASNKSVLSESVSSKTEESSMALVSDLEFQEIIGSGGSCTVYKGVYKGKTVAIKLMKQIPSKSNFMKEFHREIQTLSKLKHPNLVMFLGACIGEKCCIVTEYCAGKTLFNLLYERREVKLS